LRERIALIDRLQCVPRRLPGRGAALASVAGSSLVGRVRGLEPRSRLPAPGIHAALNTPVSPATPTEPQRAATVVGPERRGGWPVAPPPLRRHGGLSSHRVGDSDCAGWPN